MSFLFTTTSGARLFRRRRLAERTRAAQGAAVADTHLTAAQTPRLAGIDAQMPDSMPRAEDDRATHDGSPEFHDRPGSGKDTTTRSFYF